MRREKSELKQLVKEQEGSGQSVSEFCAKRAIAVNRFYVWRQKFGNLEQDRFARVETATGKISLEISETLTLTVREEDLGKVLKELLACGK